MPLQKCQLIRTPSPLQSCIFAHLPRTNGQSAGLTFLDPSVVFDRLVHPSPLGSMAAPPLVLFLPTDQRPSVSSSDSSPPAWPLSVRLCQGWVMGSLPSYKPPLSILIPIHFQFIFILITLKFISPAHTSLSTQITLLDICPWTDTPKFTTSTAKLLGSLPKLPLKFSSPCNPQLRKWLHYPCHCLCQIKYRNLP